MSEPSNHPDSEPHPTVSAAERQEFEDENEEFVLRCFRVLIEELAGMLLTVAVPLWHLVRYMFYDAWRK